MYLLEIHTLSLIVEDLTVLLSHQVGKTNCCHESEVYKFINHKSDK